MQSGRETTLASHQENSNTEAEAFLFFSESSLLKYFPKWFIKMPYRISLSVRSYIYIYMAICTNIHMDILLCKVTATPGRSRTFNLIEHLKPNTQPLALARAQVEPGLLQDSLCVLCWACVEAMK